jgi:hypothetical protein
MEKKEKTRKKLELTVELLDLKTGEETPKIAIYLLDATGKVQKKVATVKDGKLTLDVALAREKQKILAIGPDSEKPEQIRLNTLLQFRIGDQWSHWEKTKVVEIPRDWWIAWPWIKICVSGRVRKCWPFILPYPRAELGGVSLGIPYTPFLRCAPICNGVVEVYERVCCCPVITPINISDILKKLKMYLKVHPRKVWPPPPPEQGVPFPGPRPDPAPFDRVTLRSLKQAEAMGVNLSSAEPPLDMSADIRALQELPHSEAVSYILAKPYLWSFVCKCSEHKLGEVVLGPDGHFTFCYFRFPIVLHMKCWRSYYYKVRQWQENKWVYIYDGAAAKKYFTLDEFAELRTWLGRACIGDEPDVPYDKPFVMLQDIGSTHSYRLVSPTQTGENSVAVPPANGGLVDPPSGGGATLMQLVNRPWGKVLYFRLYFHPNMKLLGAKYYRLSILPVDANGNVASGETPTFLPNPMAALSWLKFVYVGGKADVQGQILGPVDPSTVGGNVGLFEIPYREDALWLEGQFHGYWDTRLDTNGRYLLAVEVFNAAGQRLTPGVAAGGDVHANFDYLKWLKEKGSGSTSKVAFAKLQHLFWIDNLPVMADIVDLRKNGFAYGDECQFMTGLSDTKFSVGFRAFHPTVDSTLPPETFMYYYTLWWHRGLNGPNATIETGGANKPSNSIADPPAESNSQKFANMLDSSAVGAKCTFAVNLWVYAKHTNGSRRLHEYDRYDQAAFALEITS